MPASPVTFDRSPFFGENTPVGAPEPEMSRSTTTELGGGGQGGKMHVLYFETTSSLRKNHKAVTLESYPHLFWVIAIINTPLIRSSLKD